jgi:putative membrane protein
MHWQQQGKPPDYRFSLANERTFLAWIRTALGVLAGGILLHQFVHTPNPRWLVAGLALMLVLLATFLAAGAYVRWKAVEQAMRLDQPLPRSYLIPVMSLGLALLGLGVAAFLVLE